MRSAEIWYKSALAGVLTEKEDGYSFAYHTDYLCLPDAQPISLTMPLQAAPLTSTVLFPFFDGLIPEGWLLLVAERNWKINSRDRMGLLLACCKDCIGAVSVRPITANREEDE